MPYNNTPIAPPKDVTGQVSLPLARVQKIINADPERLHTSKNAAFAIALATEMFIQHLAETTHNVVKAERKPRRNIQYRDVASSVSKTDNLEFLTDVVPKTTTYGEFKKRQEAAKKEAEKGKAAAAAAAKNGDVREALAGPSGTGSGSGSKSGAVNGHGATAEEKPPNGESSNEPAAAARGGEDPMDVDEEEGGVEIPKEVESEPEEDGAAMQIEMEMRGPRTTNGSPVRRRQESPVRRPSGFTAINGAR